MPQPNTRCRILGIDKAGIEHVHDLDRDRIVAISDEGIEAQYDLRMMEQDAADYMHFVDEQLGWAKEQWTGYKVAEAVFGGRR